MLPLRPSSSSFCTRFSDARLNTTEVGIANTHHSKRKLDCRGPCFNFSTYPCVFFVTYHCAVQPGGRFSAGDAIKVVDENRLVWLMIGHGRSRSPNFLAALAIEPEPPSISLRLRVAYVYAFGPALGLICDSRNAIKYAALRLQLANACLFLSTKGSAGWI
jgi:hypothetical protein